MTQNQLNRAVAHATGETIDTIRQMGFSVADPDHVRFDSEPPDVREIQTPAPSGNSAHGVIRRKQAHVQPISQAVETKRVLLNEALDLDDFNDRMASVLNDIDT